MKPENKPVIYKLTSPSGKVYVGQTVCFARRMWQHGDGKAKKYAKLGNAIAKYGFESFEKGILEEVDCASKLDEREIFWIQALDSVKSGYNASSGGCRAAWSEETRKAYGARRVGMKYSEAHKAAIKAGIARRGGSPRKGKTHSEEARALMREHWRTHGNPQSGKPLTETQRNAIRESNIRRGGSHLTEEHKAAVSAALKEYYSKNPSPNTGKKHSEARRAANSEARKAYHAKNRALKAALSQE